MARNNPVLELLCGPTGRRVFRGLMRDRATIFMLHRIEDDHQGIHGHTIEFVQAALRALEASGARFVSLRSLVARWRAGRPIEPDSVAFTIDDGYSDQAELVRQVFVPAKCPVTVFLITGFLDRKLWPWDNQLAYVFAKAAAVQTELLIGNCGLKVDLSTVQSRSDAMHQARDLCKEVGSEGVYELVQSIAQKLDVAIPAAAPSQYQPMTWDTARELERLGVEFGPHSVTHRIFSQLSHADAREELSTCWTRLTEELVDPLRVLAWPTGRRRDFSAKDIAVAHELGFDACVATDSDYAHVPPNAPRALYQLRRFGFPTHLSEVLACGSWLERGKQILSRQ